MASGWVAHLAFAWIAKRARSASRGRRCCCQRWAKRHKAAKADVRSSRRRGKGVHRPRAPTLRAATAARAATGATSSRLGATTSRAATTRKTVGVVGEAADSDIGEAAG